MKINLMASMALMFCSASIHADEVNFILINNKSNGTENEIRQVDRSTTADPEYHRNVRNAIARNLVMGRLAGSNHETEVLVTISAEGRVLSRSIIQSSGNIEWNDTVIRAIDRTDTFPKDVYGIAPSPMILIFNSGI
jgi:colicin import membrane protein